MEVQLGKNYRPKEEVSQGSAEKSMGYEKTSSFLILYLVTISVNIKNRRKNF